MESIIFDVHSADDDILAAPSANCLRILEFICTRFSATVANFWMSAAKDQMPRWPAM
jgi:hypothetical protein